MTMYRLSYFDFRRIMQKNIEHKLRKKPLEGKNLLPLNVAVAETNRKLGANIKPLSVSSPLYSTLKLAGNEAFPRLFSMAVAPVV